jgi:hypothetical protein
VSICRSAWIRHGCCDVDFIDTTRVPERDIFMDQIEHTAPRLASGETRALVVQFPTIQSDDLIEEPRRLVQVRQDAGFIAQLIATAEHLPQTRSLRRADAADAQQSYRCVVDQDRPAPQVRATTSRVV